MHKHTKASYLIVTVIILTGVGAWIQFKNKKVDVVRVPATTFEECVVNGNPVMESYPRQCRDGETTFTENVGNVLE